MADNTHTKPKGDSAFWDTCTKMLRGLFIAIGLLGFLSYVFSFWGSV